MIRLPVAITSTRNHNRIHHKDWICRDNNVLAFFNGITPPVTSDNRKIAQGFSFIFDKVHYSLPQNDSKQVSEKKREQLYEQILKEAVSYGVGIVDAKRIDEINILQATYEAMREAVSQLTLPLGHVLADAVRIPKLTVAQTPIIKGDAKCYSIAAASIIAKVTRDRIMREYDRIYPGYGFSDNKVYGSAAHIETLKKKGPVPIHRRTFISAFWQGEQD